MSDYRCAVCGARAVVLRGAEDGRRWLCRAHAGDAPEGWPVLAYQRDERDEPDSGEGECKALGPPPGAGQSPGLRPAPGGPADRPSPDWDALIAEVAPPRTDGVLPVRGTAEWSAFMRALNGWSGKPEEGKEGGPGAD